MSSLNPVWLRVPGPAPSRRSIDPVLVALGVGVTVAAAVTAAWFGLRETAPVLLVTAAIGAATVALRRIAAAIYHPVLSYGGSVVHEPVDAAFVPAWEVTVRNAGTAAAYVTGVTYHPRAGGRSWTVDGDDYEGLRAARDEAGIGYPHADPTRLTRGVVIGPGDRLVLLTAFPEAVRAVDAVDVELHYRGPFRWHRKTIRCITAGAQDVHVAEALGHRLGDQPRAELVTDAAVAPPASAG